MAALHDAAMAHATRTRGELQKIVVDEWDGSEVYFYPVFNLEEMAAIQQALEDGGEFMGKAEVFILGARDASGARLFNRVNRKQVVEDYDSAVVSAIADRMGGLDGFVTRYAEAVKKLSTTQEAPGAKPSATLAHSA